MPDANDLRHYPSIRPGDWAALNRELRRIVDQLGSSGASLIDFYKNSTLVGTRGGLNLIEGARITLTLTDSSASDRVNATIAAAASTPTTLPVYPADKGAGAIIGGKLSTIGTSLTGVTPMCETAAVGAETNPIVWPCNSWIGQIALCLSTTETAETFVRGGMGSTESGSGAIRVLWDVSVPPGSAADAYTGEGAQWLYIPRGADPRAFIVSGYSAVGPAASAYSSWSAESVQDDGTIPLAKRWVGAAAGATTYSAISGVSADPTENNMRTVMPACTISHLSLRLTSAVTGDTQVITIMKNGSATGITMTIPAGAAIGDCFIDWTNTATFAADDTISIRSVGGAAIAASGAGILSFKITPSGFTAFLCGWPVNDTGDPTADYEMPFYEYGSAAVQTEANSFFAMPRAVTISTGALKVWLVTAPGTSWDWTVRKEGSDTACVASISSGSTPGVITSAGADVNFALGDRFTLKHILVGASGKIGGWSIAIP